MNALGIDLGGTNVKAVVINPAGELLTKIHMPIKDGFWKEAVKSAFELIQEKEIPFLALGLSAPGLPDHHNRKINHMPGRLPGLEGFSWSEYLGKETVVINDAHAAMVAEANFGSAKGVSNAIMLTLGTGVGGAILINGKLFQGMMQRAGSIGDMSLNAESTEIGFLKVPGTLEDAIGNESVPHRSNQVFQTTQQLVEAYAKGDLKAREVWLKSVKKLAVALCSLINILAPEKIVLGGGIVQAGDHLFKPLEEFMNLYEWRPTGWATPIVRATFDDFAGAIGAACFASEQQKLS